MPDETLAPDLAKHITNTAAEVLNSPPRGTWVRVRRLDSMLYSENGSDPEQDIDPVFVSVLKSRLEADELADEADRLAESISEVCSRPKENVHILYLPESRGRVALGGNLIE